jgi:hypothetical protein
MRTLSARRLSESLRYAAYFAENLFSAHCVQSEHSPSDEGGKRLSRSRRVMNRTVRSRE